MIFPNAYVRRSTPPPGTTDAELRLDWAPGPETPIRLDSAHLHLWVANLTEFMDQTQNFAALLPHAERNSAGNFRFPGDRERYVVRRGLLRLILSRYVDRRPSAMEFQNGVFGKPELRNPAAAAPIFFNASHSSDVAVWAITSTCPVGVDVEQVKEVQDFEKLAERFFRPAETRALLALPEESRMQAFYNCWTSKEAFLKATGEGITQSLAKVEVTLAPGDKRRVVSITNEPGAQEQWQLQPFLPAHGYLGCVAYRNSVLTTSRWRFTKSMLGSTDVWSPASANAK